jgi:hypothetical protein
MLLSNQKRLVARVEMEKDNYAAKPFGGYMRACESFQWTVEGLAALLTLVILCQRSRRMLKRRTIQPAQ